MPKTQHTQRKLLNFEFWINGKLSKGAKILLSKSIFCVKSHPNLSHFFSLKNTNLGAHFLLLTFFDKINFKITLLLKWCPIFDSSPLIQNSKFNNFLWVCWFLCKNLSNFVPPRLKTPQPVLPYWISRMGPNFDAYPGFQPKITNPKHFCPSCIWGNKLLIRVKYCPTVIYHCLSWLFEIDSLS